MSINDEEVLVGIQRFMHNLVATGMTLDELPLLLSKIRGIGELLLGEPDYDQTS